ncbi:MAG: 5'-3' exonuclease [Nocardioides sp.]
MSEPTDATASPAPPPASSASTAPQPGSRMLLDTASLYFRAFFGVPDSFRAPDGTPVNAVRGLLDFISRLTEQYRPAELVCCWDNDWRPAWRVALIPSYKAHRLVRATPGDAPDIEEVPDPLSRQVPIILDVLDALGIAVVGVDGYEADDVIGTLATDAGRPVQVVTGDRDLFQLVDDQLGIRVLYTARGVSRHEVITESVVLDKYGVHASQYADFATLRGDASDGLPGVRGVGEKTAATLLGRFGTIDGLMAAAADPDSDLAPGPRSKLKEASAYLEVAPEAVAVARHLAVPRQGLELPRSPRDPARLVELAGQWNLDSPLARLVDVLTSSNN